MVNSIGEVFLVTQNNGSSRWAFVNEADILPSLQTTYGQMDHTVIKIDRDEYLVRYLRDDAVNEDVFTVQRVPVLEQPNHL
jgi:hypothetical protein